MPLKFELYIDLGNDAMSTPEDIAGALRKVADKLTNPGDFDQEPIESPIHTQSVFDINGNRVGGYRVIRAEE